MAAVNGNKPHVLAIPPPAQGHVKPLMTLCRQIAKRGIKVTFVNAQSIHERIVSAARSSGEDIVLATVPDGLAPGEDPNDTFALMGALAKTMPETLTDLIDKINSSNPAQRVSCVIADLSFAWVFDIAEKMGAEPIGFSPSSLASLAMMLVTPKLLEQGILDDNGSLKKGGVISLADGIPDWREIELPWSVPGNPETQKFIFDTVKVYKDAHKAKWILCNSCYELEAELLPGLLPLGPLHLLNTDSVTPWSAPTSFYSEDESCLSWLDDKPDGSVIYVSFGSLAVLSQQQLDELALGLELSGQAFLWVVRLDLANGSQVMYPDGFLERVIEIGKIIEWAPQNKVLSHSSIGCFVSHCGWNSTLEGVSSGVPFLCWPYFADQFHNEKYICEKWENGLQIDIDVDGIRSRHEINKKLDMVFSVNKFRANALKLKEMCGKSISEGGLSYKNLERFLDHLL